MHWTFLLVAIAIAVVGQGLLKAGAGAETLLDQFFDWRTIVGLGVYGFSSVLYILALRRIPLSVALPCTALSYIMVALIGYYMFNEPVGGMRVFGLGLIGTGVLVLALA